MAQGCLCKHTAHSYVCHLWLLPLYDGRIRQLKQKLVHTTKLNLLLAGSRMSLLKLVEQYKLRLAKDN